MKVRVLQVNYSFAGGGAGALAGSLAAAVVAAGHRSGLAGVIPPVETDHAWLGLGSRPATGVGPARLRRWASLAANPAKLIDVVAGIEDHHCPASRRLLAVAGDWDVVHLHNLHGSPAWFDLRLLPELCRRVPVVFTMHDAWSFTGHCAHPVGCERWRTGCGSCPDLGIYPMVRRDGTATGWIRKAAIFSESRLQVAAPSRWLLDRARDSLIAPGAAGWHHIPNGIDLGVFRPGPREAARARLGLPAGIPILSFVAMGLRGNPFKDWQTLDDALHLVGSTVDGPAIALAIGDRGEPLVRGRMRVEFIPACQDPGRLADYYRASDLYVHAARADTFPYTVLEAQACGLPVVASEVGGIPEQVRGDPMDPARDGTLVPAANPPLLAEAISTLLRDAELRRVLGHRAARRAAAGHAVEGCSAAYLRLYASLAR